MTPQPQGEFRPKTLTRTDANPLDSEVFQLADRLEMLAILCRNLAESYPEIARLKRIERYARTAFEHMEHAKPIVRGLWSEAAKAAEQGGAA